MRVGEKCSDVFQLLFTNRVRLADSPKLADQPKIRQLHKRWKVLKRIGRMDSGKISSYRELREATII